MSINDQFDMSVFDGTPFEGLTYLQVRRRMTQAQLKRWKHINKSQRKLAKLHDAVQKQVARK